MFFGMTAKPNGPHPDIRLLPDIPDQFGDPAGREEAAEVHLEQAVLGRYKPLCHDGIREVLGINVGHPLLIPEDIDRIL